MSRLTRDGTVEPVSRDQILRRERGQGNIHFSCSADHVQDWQPYPVDPYSRYMCDHTVSHFLPMRGHAMPHVIGHDQSHLIPQRCQSQPNCSGHLRHRLQTHLPLGYTPPKFTLAIEAQHPYTPHQNQWLDVELVHFSQPPFFPYIQTRDGTSVLFNCLDYSITLLKRTTQGGGGGN